MNDATGAAGAGELCNPKPNGVPVGADVRGTNRNAESVAGCVAAVANGDPEVNDATGAAGADGSGSAKWNGVPSGDVEADVKGANRNSGGVAGELAAG